MTEHRISLSAIAKACRDGAHSIFSASGSHLWLHCPGGLIPNVLAPDSSGREAAEGTVAHGVGELWVRSGQRPGHLIGTVETVNEGDDAYEIEITAEMLSYLEEYYDLCSMMPGRHFVETKVYYDDLTPIDRQGGTADFAACTWRKLVIVDLKYGKGVFVNVANNPQLLLYAYGFFREWDWLYDFQEIEIHVCQPRMGNVEKITISREALLLFAEKVKATASVAWSFDAPRIAGTTQCQFCRVQHECAAHFAWQASLTEGAWSDEDAHDDARANPTVDVVLDVKQRVEWMQEFNMMNPYNLDTTDLAYLYTKRSTFEAWWKKVQTELMKRSASGKLVPGLKVVEARSNRKIRDIEEAKDVLMHQVDEQFRLSESDLISTKVRSPKQIEEKLHARGLRGVALEKVMKPLVHKPPGKPTLVPLTDPREPLVDLGAEAFEDLDAESEEDAD